MLNTNDCGRKSKQNPVTENSKGGSSKLKGWLGTLLICLSSQRVVLRQQKQLISELEDLPFSLTFKSSCFSNERSLIIGSTTRSGHPTKQGQFELK